MLLGHTCWLVKTIIKHMFQSINLPVKRIEGEKVDQNDKYNKSDKIFLPSFFSIFENIVRPKQAYICHNPNKKPWMKFILYYVTVHLVLRKTCLLGFSNAYFSQWRYVCQICGLLWLRLPMCTLVFKVMTYNSSK